MCKFGSHQSPLTGIVVLLHSSRLLCASCAWRRWMNQTVTNWPPVGHVIYWYSSDVVQERERREIKRERQHELGLWRTLCARLRVRVIVRYSRCARFELLGTQRIGRSIAVWMKVLFWAHDFIVIAGDLTSARCGWCAFGRQQIDNTGLERCWW